MRNQYHADTVIEVFMTGKREKWKSCNAYIYHVSSLWKLRKKVLVTLIQTFYAQEKAGPATFLRVSCQTCFTAGAGTGPAEWAELQLPSSADSKEQRSVGGRPGQACGRTSPQTVADSLSARPQRLGTRGQGKGLLFTKKRRKKTEKK